MRISFLCGGLEPGADGVGDYTRRLACECIRRRHSSIIIALNDSRVSQPLCERQQADEVEIPVLRLPRSMSWGDRFHEVLERLNAFTPDWISLQFVPFSFHPKGLCFELSRELRRLRIEATWHVMFHELWLGLEDKASMKLRAWGGMQRSIIVNLVTQLKPRQMHTQAEAYRAVLQREGIQADILPLFGNIPHAENDNYSKVLQPYLSDSLSEFGGRDGLYLAGVFGSVHKEWDVETCLDALLPLVKQSQKQLVLVFLGRNNLTSAALSTLKDKLRDHAIVIRTGDRTPAEISQILRSLDLGLATTPRQLIQKSGSVAAMLEHGLSVLVTRDDWKLRELSPASGASSARLLSPEQLSRLKSLPVRAPVASGESSAARVAAQMLSAMEPHQMPVSVP